MTCCVFKLIPEGNRIISTWAGPKPVSPHTHLCLLHNRVVSTVHTYSVKWTFRSFGITGKALCELCCKLSPSLWVFCVTKHHWTPPTPVVHLLSCVHYSIWQWVHIHRPCQCQQFLCPQPHNGCGQGDGLLSHTMLTFSRSDTHKK